MRGGGGEQGRGQSYLGEKGRKRRPSLRQFLLYKKLRYFFRLFVAYDWNGRNADLVVRGIAGVREQEDII